MFETSRDILNISISVAVVVLVIFLCVALYYLISNLKRVDKISRQVEKGIDKVDNLVDLIKDKVKQSSSYFILLGNLVEKGIDYFSRKRQERREENEDDYRKTSRKTKK